MSETLEAKLMSLQFKLREVREKRDASRNVPEQPVCSTANNVSTENGEGKDASDAVARFSRSRAVRGRSGSKFSKRGHMSLDCRPKVLSVTNVPEGFSDVADQHFARYKIP